MNPTAGFALARDPFAHDRYLLRRTFFKVFGASFRIFDPAGNLAFFSKQKAFKLKEDIRVYADEEMRHELLVISARNLLDIAATYDVRDARTGEPLGALRRKALASVVRDEWTILDRDGREVGLIQEDSVFLALLRRFLAAFVPQTFVGQVGGQPVLVFRQSWNLFLQKIELDFSGDRERRLDRRLGLAAGVLLCAIEGRQQ